MAVTDTQLDELKDFAYELGRDLALGIDPKGHDILSAVLDRAEEAGMVTEDEYADPITIEDLPAEEDRKDIIGAYVRAVEDK